MRNLSPQARPATNLPSDGEFADISDSCKIRIRIRANFKVSSFAIFQFQPFPSVRTIRAVTEIVSTLHSTNQRLDFHRSYMASATSLQTTVWLARPNS